jgi:hypothetical protein
MTLHFKVGENKVIGIKESFYSEAIEEFIIDLTGKTMYVRKNAPNILIIRTEKDFGYSITFSGDKEVYNLMREIKDKL